MQQRDLLVQNLWQHINANLLLTRLPELNVALAELVVFGLEQHDLREDLVGKGAGHDEGGVAGRAAQVDEAAFREQDDVPSVLHQVAVDLGLDVLDRLGVGFEPGDVDFDVEVSDV